MFSPPFTFYGATAIYLSSTFLIHILSTNFRVPYLHSEWLCWSFLLLAAKLARPSKDDDQGATTRSDKLALAIAALCAFRTIGGVDWALPLLTPLSLLIVHQASTANLQLESLEKAQLVGNVPHRGLFSLRSAPALSLVPAILSAAWLLPVPYSAWQICAGVTFALVLMVVYMLIHEQRDEPLSEQDADRIPLPHSATSWRALAVLTMMLLIAPKSYLPTKFSEPVTLVAVAMLKSLQWVMVVELVRKGFMTPLTTTSTFAISTLRTFHLQATTGRAGLVASVAIISLVQTQRFIQKTSYNRRVLSAIGCIFVLGLVANQPMSDDHTLQGTWMGSLFAGNEPHPIELLVYEANEEFRSMVEGQSKTLPDAIAEYEKRYRMEPPPGFDQWFKLAMESNCTIVDNFDTVMQSLEPFWGITAKEMRARADMFTQTPLAKWALQNKKPTKLSDSLVLGGFNAILQGWLERFKDILPDMEITINGLAEPRVIVPNDRLDHLIRTCPRVDPTAIGDQQRKPLEMMNLGKDKSWQIGTRSCPENSPSRSIFLPAEEEGLQFIRNITKSKDICEAPEAAISHAMFLAPYNLKVTDTLVPVFSHGKPSSSQDILYPSPDYIEGYRKGNYNETLDPLWENKTNQLYWTGSDTGGYASGDNWRHFHRQRFVDMVTNSQNEISILQRVKSGRFGKSTSWEARKQTMASLSDLVHVHFTSMDICAGSACSAEKQALPVGKVEGRSAGYGSKFIFDVDGMGRTERYYRLLASRSTVFKQTMYQEWHDDRIVPWVHFVPVSLGMGELPEILNFMAKDGRGQAIAKNIADAGRTWQQVALREEDIDLAFLRIMLEYARLISDERDQSGMCPRGRTRVTGR